MKVRALQLQRFLQGNTQRLDIKRAQQTGIMTSPRMSTLSQCWLVDTSGMLSPCYVIQLLMHAMR